FFIERRGKIKLYDPKKNQTELIGEMQVSLKYNNGNQAEDGLLGIALDPNFDKTQWVYLFYSPVGNIPKQHISRFNFTNGKIDFTSEKVVFQIPNQRDECCHSAGSLLFDDAGNLFISVGDNTNPFATPYSPSDNRPNRSAWDAGKSSSNMNDLRGKVLRIHPQPDGTYTIPEGNLFAKDGNQGKPEIYVMGCRNPYRISWDYKRKFLYWGDVGPDASKDSTRGPRGYDEVNQARKPGYFGWPFFIADNKPYTMVDFNTNQHLGKYDPQNPVNNSPNNTGAKNLPPAQPAFIYYPYADSPEFPQMGTGGRNAMAGPVYYYNDYPTDSPVKFPKYFDGKQLIYDWMRGWIKVLTLKPNGDLLEMEPLMPNTTFSNPTDMQFGKDGSLYILEYGYTWFGKDPSAKLIWVTYESGNRTPVAKINTSNAIGGLPLAVNFSAKGSFDPDEDAVSYLWNFDGKATSTEENPAFTYTKAGIYNATLTVTDKSGKTALTKVEVKAGNNLPEIQFVSNANKTFYHDNQQVDYKVKVTDKDEEEIDESNVKITLNFIADGHDKVEIEAGHREVKADAEINNALIAKSDCKACHKLNGESVGPSYVQVANRYRNDAKATDYLANKIIVGGGGVWGEHVMSAHPGISKNEATEIAKYILSLSGQKELLPMSGNYKAVQHIGQGDNGRYYLTASYADKGTPEIGSLMRTKTWVLRNPKLQAEDADIKIKASKTNNGTATTGVSDGSVLVFKQVDLQGITGLVFRITSKSNYGTLELRTGSQDGNLLAKVDYSPTADFTNLAIACKASTDIHDVYVVFRKNEQTKDNQINCRLDWIEFKQTIVQTGK
ncbi:MAG: PQQ-dependent sugar dehydrogenase, partial [Verrucomicrobia bacterium]|nr:PQQ-dependent sugar dehydrogenase [Cytophagales bacterium]